MPDPADAFLVSLLDPAGRAVGVGVLVGPRQVVTGAQVVNTAVGRESHAQDRPAVPVALRFIGRDSEPITATVERWMPPPTPHALGDDIAGLVLNADPPAGAQQAHLIVTMPPRDHPVRVFGYPSAPDESAGVWVPTAVRGGVDAGRVPLDAGPDAVLRTQPGFRGSPVVDDVTGRIIGVLTEAAPGRASERDAVAIAADRLRVAWPEVLNPREDIPPVRDRTPTGGELTVLHLSDPQFGHHHLFGGNGLTQADRDHDSLFARLHDDLLRLAERPGLRPDLVLVTGDLAEWARPSEFDHVTTFLGLLAEAVELPRRNVVIVPGNHDISRDACEGYFKREQSKERDPLPPFWPKWEEYELAFKRFYDGERGVAFTPDEPWTFVELPELRVVVAGLNSTMAESHREADHYGWVGEDQLRAFAERLAIYKKRGWLRLGAIHHNAVRGLVRDDENLRDADDLDRILGETNLLNLLFHGHTHDGRLHRLPSGLVALSTGSAAVDASARPTEVPNQYQFVTIRRDGLTRYARQYVVSDREWIGDTRVSADRMTAQHDLRLELHNAGATFLQNDAMPGQSVDPVPFHPSFLDLVVDATEAREPTAHVAVAGGFGYLRVTKTVDGGVEMWLVGVVDGPLTEDAVTAFATGPHAAFRAKDPGARSLIVYAGTRAADSLIAAARRAAVTAYSFREYQGLIDLDELAARQEARLAGDDLYPARLYVAHRFQVLTGPTAVPDRGGVRTGLVEQVVQWLDDDQARLVMVLGDFGCGKTALLRQLARQLPELLPGIQPVLIELRGLEKAPSLDELLAQHLVRQGVGEFDIAKLRYMITSGRLALLFDGYDELELRVGPVNAAEYLQVLLTSVVGRAKVVITSRTQHFRSNAQVQSALGSYVATRSGSRLTLLEGFSPDQILDYLTRLYDGDAERAAARRERLGQIENLLGLSENPRMLAFIAALPDDRLEEIHQRHGRISSAQLYEEIVSFWLRHETDRQQHPHGLPSLDLDEREAACTELAVRLWGSAATTIPVGDLEETVASTLRGLTERGYSTEQAGHAIGSGSLLVRGDDGGFGFIHQSIMEWLVAAAAARGIADGAPMLVQRRMSRLMVDFFVDLVEHAEARRWVRAVLVDREASAAARANALAVEDQLGPDRSGEFYRVNLVRSDLRGQDLSGQDFRGADLTDAVLSGMRLDDVDFTDADLSGADFSGARLRRGSLRRARFDGSRWHRAALLGVDGVDELWDQPELATAAIPERDGVAPMLLGPIAGMRGVACAADGVVVAVGQGSDVGLYDAVDGVPLRVLSGHTGEVKAVAFTPDGASLVSVADDRTARVWDLRTGRVRRVLTGHIGAVYGVAVSPDGSLVATASADRTARTWDLQTGNALAVFRGHEDEVNAVAFAPRYGEVLATASDDGTARTWDVQTGRPHAVFRGHGQRVWAVAFSSDGESLATGSADETVRIWDVGTAETRTPLTGHHGSVNAVAFSDFSDPSNPFLYEFATASGDGTVRLWDLVGGTGARVIEGHAAVWGAAYSPNGVTLAASSADGSLRIVDNMIGQTRHTMTGLRRRLWGVAFSPDGTLLSTSSDHSVRIWNRDGRVLGTRPRRPDPDARPMAAERVSDLAFSPDGRTLAFVGDDVGLWDTTTGGVRTLVEGPDSAGATGVAFAPDGATLATAGHDGAARLWDVTTETVRVTLRGHTRLLWAVAFSPDGATLATTSGDHTARLWDVATGRSRTVLTGHTDSVLGAAFSPDGATVATASSDGTARLWDVASGRPLAVLIAHAGLTVGVAFSPDGATVATTAGDGSVHLFDVGTARPRATLTGHSNLVVGVAFSPDGTLLATTSYDGSARLWDPYTGELVARFVAAGDESAALFEDGSYTVNGGLAWWMVGLCRFEAGELDEFVPGVRLRWPSLDAWRVRVIG